MKLNLKGFFLKKKKSKTLGMEDWEGEDEEEYRRDMNERDMNKIKNKLKTEGYRDAQSDDAEQYSEEALQVGFNEGFRMSAESAFMSNFIKAVSLVLGKNNNGSEENEIWQGLCLELKGDCKTDLDPNLANYNPFTTQKQL